MRMIGYMVLILLLVGCSAATDDTAVPAASPSIVSAPTAEATAVPAAIPTTPAPSPTPPASAATTAPAATPTTSPTLAEAVAAWSYPIGLPDRPLGDGFFIRHGYTVENTWYNPGYWHTGEDWYALDGDTAGAGVFAVAAGEVVYAGSNYPGRVVIIRHGEDLFSMYGHLDPTLRVRQGARVARGQQLGTVLRRGDNVPNHLHFEIRMFLTSTKVNGASPRYGFRCGANCAPGPGYWPIDAPDLPSDLGWLHPTHVIARRMVTPQSAAELGEVVVAADPVSASATLWAEVTDDGAPRHLLGEATLPPGARFTLMEIRAGPEATQSTSAESYVLWYRVRLPDGREGWIQSAVPSDFESGSDGRPSTTRFNLYPRLRGN